MKKIIDELFWLIILAALFIAWIISNSIYLIIKGLTRLFKRAIIKYRG